MNNDFKQQQISRINLYALISRLMMSEVEPSLLASIQADENILSFFPNFQKWQKLQELSAKELKEQYLDVDFANLFLLHLVPYESFYMREDQMMETGGDNPVQKLFNDFDFRVELDKARVMSADHIGVELEFMYKLCESEKKALEADDTHAAAQIAQIEYHFLQEHLLEWAPMFLLNVKSEACTPLYFDVADLALEFMLSDFEYLTQLKNSDYRYEI